LIAGCRPRPRSDALICVAIAVIHAGVPLLGRQLEFRDGEAVAKDDLVLWAFVAAALLIPGGSHDEFTCPDDQHFRAAGAFLKGRVALEAARRAWENAPDRSKNDALLMGFALTQALGKSRPRRNDIPRTDLGFIKLSQKTALHRKLRAQALVGGLTLAVALILTGWLYEQTVARFYGQTLLRLKETFYWLTDVRGQILTAAAERVLGPVHAAIECFVVLHRLPRADTLFADQQDEGCRFGDPVGKLREP
jgi:hypothetical protein